MRLEMTRTFPVPRQRAWGYANDFHTWPEWYGGELVEPDKSSFDKPGDTVRMADTSMGFRWTGALILEEKVAPEFTRTLYRWRGWPDFHVEIHYMEAGPGACTIRMVGYVDENAGLVGKSIGWLSMNVPLLMQREVRRMFDRLDALFRESTPGKKEGTKPAAKARPAKKKVA